MEARAVWARSPNDASLPVVGNGREDGRKRRREGRGREKVEGQGRLYGGRKRDHKRLSNPPSQQIISRSSTAKQPSADHQQEKQQWHIACVFGLLPHQLAVCGVRSCLYLEGGRIRVASGWDDR